MLHQREGVVPIPYKIVSCSSENNFSNSGNLNSETGVLNDKNAYWISSSYNVINNYLDILNYLSNWKYFYITEQKLKICKFF